MATRPEIASPFGQPHDSSPTRVESPSHSRTESRSTVHYDDVEHYGYPHIHGIEDLNLYRRGGFHPVLYGDRLGPGGRFEVVHKLGHGGFATVWLCFDSWKHDWKAIKIVQACASRKAEASENYILNFFMT
ncbi:hypothetical protein GE09DRAFT_1063573 [Coniochaeta sp. 2T2.1]|nr:hypothetical protein GE09DRAFT_1063573 [Coniochaeta sp. 2T2.1]